MKNIILGIIILTSFNLFAEKSSTPAIKLPRVLLIGDSISKGCTPYVAEMMKKRALVTHNKGKAGLTMLALENIDVWLDGYAAEAGVGIENAFDDREEVRG
ncbi:MAG: hypothetical protein GXP30_08830 [Verrucomicrobia bacterium]|nr:hypothetical protein [Verrucomicrobiota bacterium]